VPANDLFFQFQLLPHNIVLCFDLKEGDMVRLTNSLGRVYRARSIEIETSLFLVDGWPEFMAVCGVDCGDYLLFEVEGYRSLKITVFAQNGTEKQPSNDGSIGQGVVKSLELNNSGTQV
jgi:hypothetical protein